MKPLGIIAAGTLLAVGLTACVELPPVSDGGGGYSYGYEDSTSGVGLPMSRYPQMERLPGYPVYYDPYARANYFFYDGLYWLYQQDNWYASSWYDGPWGFVSPRSVPYYLLRVPVRFYRAPPSYFRSWRPDEPPHWGEHWGRNWEEQRRDWNRWDRRSMPPAAPLPVYQRDYPGDRYPRDADRQHEIRDRNYRYEPREEVTRQQWQQHGQPGHEPQPQRHEPTAPAPQHEPHEQHRRNPPPASPPVSPPAATPASPSVGNHPKKAPPPVKSRDIKEDPQGQERD